MTRISEKYIYLKKAKKKLKRYFTLKLLISFLILSSCNKECKKSNELEFVNGKYYCGKKLFSGNIQNLNPEVQETPGGSITQSINSIEKYVEGKLIYIEDRGKSGWLRNRTYYYYEIDDNINLKGISKKLYNQKFNNNYESSSFDFVSPWFYDFYEIKGRIPMQEDGKMYISNFPTQRENGMDYFYEPDLNENTKLSNATDPYGNTKSLVGSLYSSRTDFRDSLVMSRVKYYENLITTTFSLTGESGTETQIQVFKEYNGEVNLHEDFHGGLLGTSFTNVNPKKFITLEYNILNLDKETKRLDSINNTLTTIYSDIICRNKLYHKCLVQQGELSVGTVQVIKHSDPVQKDYYRDVYQFTTIFDRPPVLGIDEDWSIN